MASTSIPGVEQDQNNLAFQQGEGTHVRTSSLHAQERDTHQYDPDDPVYNQDTRTQDCNDCDTGPNFDENQAEKAALNRIQRAFDSYGDDAFEDVARWERSYSRLSPEHKALLPRHPLKFEAAKKCIAANGYFFEKLLENFAGPGAPAHLKVEMMSQDNHRTHPGDVDKVRYVLKNLVRDWTAEGALERSQSHAPLLRELERLVPASHDSDTAPYVLVPGAGLARLCVEVAARGYCCQGNEFSYYMLLCSSFILNSMEKAEQFEIYPWVLNSCNHLTDAHQLAGMKVPDILPSDLPIRFNGLSMCAGDFVEVYSAPEQKEAWDAVVTCFFIDTAHNVLQYLEIISNILTEGGYWINMGPLLYHWSDAHTYLADEEMSIELSLDDLERIAAHYGLRMIKKEMHKCIYTQDTNSMLQSVYNAALLVMVKDSSKAFKEEAKRKNDHYNTHEKAPPSPKKCRNVD